MVKAKPLLTLFVRLGPSECWPWIGRIDAHGYGSQGRGRLAHRVVYETFVGPIPTGLTIDHTCHNSDPECAGGRLCEHRRCVNPAHLEPVTRLENTRRGKGNGSKTHCPQGHPYDETNTYRSRGARGCRACNRAAVGRYEQRLIS